MNKTQTHFAYGLVTALAMVVIGVALQVLKMSENPVLKWIGLVVFLVGIILNAQAYSKANDANVTFGEVFGSCFKATLIIAIIVGVWTFAAMSIFPEIKTHALEQAQARMESKGNLSSDQMDQALTMTRKYFTLFGVAGAFIGSLFLGVIFSLIGGGIAKKIPRPTSQFQ